MGEPVAVWVRLPTPASACQVDEGSAGIERVARAGALEDLLPEYVDDPTVQGLAGEVFYAYDLWLESRLERIEPTCDPRYVIAVVHVWHAQPGGVEPA